MDEIETYLGMGSNLGDRLENIRQGLHLLSQARGLTVEISSSIYETKPWGYTDQPRFLNCAIKCSTNLTPSELLQLAKQTETLIGRHHTFRYGPRVVDIDLLLYGNKVISIDCPDLQIPHLKMTERAFVMIPLAEIAPTYNHPTLNTDLLELSRHFVSDNDDVILWSDPICVKYFDDV
mgnify:CR=1 FL=1